MGTHLIELSESFPMNAYMTARVKMIFIIFCFFRALDLGLRKEWICNERPITICPIVTCWPHARTTR